MADTFMEYLVTKRLTTKDALLKVFIVLAGLFIAMLCFMFSPLLGMFSMFGYLAAFGVLYGAYRLFTMLNVEFEYVLTNGDMDVDKIINRSSRKRLLSVKCSSFETFGKYKAVDHQNKNYQTRIFVCSSPEDENVWYATFSHSKFGNSLLVFNANEKMLEAMRNFIPKQLAFEVFVKNRGQ